MLPFLVPVLFTFYIQGVLKKLKKFGCQKVNSIFGSRKKSQGAKSVEYGGWGMSHLVFRQKLLGEDGRVRRGVVMVKQPGLFSPK
jgi:hypothetical protein